MGKLHTYCFTTVNDDGEEEVMEVVAYSLEQAMYLTTLSSSEIVAVEETVTSASY